MYLKGQGGEGRGEHLNYTIAKAIEMVGLGRGGGLERAKRDKISFSRISFVDKEFFLCSTTVRGRKSNICSVKSRLSSAPISINDSSTF